MGTLELHGLYAPFDPLPLRLIGGGGLAFLVGQRRIARVTEHMEYDRALKGMARVGAHLALGRSARAPRLQYTRAWLSGAFEAFDRSDALASSSSSDDSRTEAAYLADLSDLLMPDFSGDLGQPRGLAPSTPPSRHFAGRSPTRRTAVPVPKR
ncbi:MAG: hypothetical protein IPG88_18340 [Gemmatimonadetes bacterium]|nr:hypothetical protein [Gemmatimonadota bacterium]